MKKSLSFFTSKVCICVTKDETNRREEVTFAGTIATDDDIVRLGLTPD